MQKKLPIILIIIFGLAVAGVSTYFLLNYAADYQELTQVVVAKSDLPAYTELTEQNIGIASVPVGGVGQNSAVDPSQVLGKATSVPLYSGEQIRLEKLVDKSQVDTSKHHVAVNLNITRCAGGSLSSGDVVDVYWLQGEGIPGALLAANSVVVSILDGEGAEVIQGQGKTPAIAVLAVKPGEVAQVVRGSADECSSIVLVKKFKIEEGDSAYVSSDKKEQTTGSEKDQNREKVAS